MYADQLEKGQTYDVLKKCVSILDFVLFELPQDLRKECSGIELWTKFINAEEREEFDMIAEKDPYIKSSYDQLQLISQDK